MVEKIAEILAGMEMGAGKTIQLCALLSRWNKIVDERVGRNTEAIKIRNRTLYVSTSSPTWAQELSFLKKEFIEKFNAQAGQEIIRDIKFKAGG